MKLGVEPEVKDAKLDEEQRLEGARLVEEQLVKDS